MAQAPDPAPSVNISMAKFVGIKNVVTEERLTPTELSSAVNIDLDDIGQVHRRQGQTLRAVGDWHSLFQTTAGINLGVCNQTLGIIQPNFSFVPLLTGIGAHPSRGSQIAFEAIGPLTYFSSPHDSGVFDDRTLTIKPWGADPDIWLSPVINPTATLPAVRGRLLGKPPLATCLTYFSGRMYMAQGNLMWATELYLYDYVDKTKNFYQFDGDITMLGAVGDGIYVGTTEGCWFLSGPFKEMKRVKVMDSAVIAGSRVYIPSEIANPPQVDLGQDTPITISILFMTTAGYCAGQNSGQVFNLTEDKVLFPDADRAYPLYRWQAGTHHYVVGLDSGGSPQSNARIGDYAAVDIIRAGSWLDLADGVVLGDSVSYT